MLIPQPLEWWLAAAADALDAAAERRPGGAADAHDALGTLLASSAQVVACSSC